jgi:acyl transferase domain-containing protein
MIHSEHLNKSCQVNESHLPDDASNGYETSLPFHLPVAIVGMAMRLPGNIDSPTKFWELLVNHGDAVGPVPTDRYKRHSKSGPLSADKGYFLGDRDLSQMDPSFFSMSKAELEQLDPHHRLLLEVVYESFESAGETSWRGKNVGCYVGFSGEDWNDLQAKDPQDFPMYRMTGSFDFALANRISYEYDLRGPR